MSSFFQQVKGPSSKRELETGAFFFVIFFFPGCYCEYSQSTGRVYSAWHFQNNPACLTGDKPVGSPASGNRVNFGGPGCDTFDVTLRPWHLSFLRFYNKKNTPISQVCLHLLYHHCFILVTILEHSNSKHVQTHWEGWNHMRSFHDLDKGMIIRTSKKNLVRLLKGIDLGNTAASSLKTSACCSETAAWQSIRLNIVFEREKSHGDKSKKSMPAKYSR